MRAPAILLAPALLGACATAVPPAPPERDGGGSCNADAARSFVGQRVSEALGAQVLAATGARSLRWGPPGGAMTMDFREDRVNVFYDSNMVVERVTCG
jgi:hypothetical protein